MNTSGLSRLPAFFPSPQDDSQSVEEPSGILPDISATAGDESAKFAERVWNVVIEAAENAASERIGDVHRGRVRSASQ
jgi:hypothetical protein